MVEEVTDLKKKEITIDSDKMNNQKVKKQKS